MSSSVGVVVAVLVAVLVCVDVSEVVAEVVCVVVRNVELVGGKVVDGSNTMRNLRRDVMKVSQTTYNV